MANRFSLPSVRQPWVDQTGRPTREIYLFMTDFVAATGSGATLGTAAFENVGTIGPNVPLLSGNNLWGGVQTFGDGHLALKGSLSGATVLKAAAAASGVITFPAATGSVPLTDIANAWSAIQTFGDGDLELVGATSGSAILKAPATSGGTVTLPAGDVTLLAGNQTITLSGDVTGSGATAIAATVAKINGAALGSTTATAGNLLIGSGTQWVTHAASGDWTISSAGATTVAKVNGVAYPASPATNTVPVVTGANTITYQVVPVLAGGTGATVLGGSLTNGGGTLAVKALASYDATPADPAGTTDLAGKMMGLAGSIAPTVSGKVQIIVNMDAANATAIVDGAKAQIRYGTGAAPANGDALAGTAVGRLGRYIAATTAQVGSIPLNALVTGLSVGTTYWIDVSLAAIAGGTAQISNVAISAVEFNG